MTEQTLDRYLKIGRKNVYCYGIDAFMILLFILRATYEDLMARKLVKGLIYKDNKVIGKFKRYLRGKNEGIIKVELKKEFIDYLKDIKDKVKVIELENGVYSKKLNEYYEPAWKIFIDDTELGIIGFGKRYDYGWGYRFFYKK